MKNVALAKPIFKKDSKRTPNDIIGLKIFFRDDNERPQYDKDALLMWKSAIDGVLLAGVSGDVYLSEPYENPKKNTDSS